MSFGMRFGYFAVHDTVVGLVPSTTIMALNCWVSEHGWYVIEVVSRPRGGRGLRGDQVALGRGTDVRLAGTLPHPQPGVLARDEFERGSDPDQHDRSDAPAPFG